MLKFINSAGDTGQPLLYYRTRVDSDGDLRFEISKDNKIWVLLTFVHSEENRVVTVADGPIENLRFTLEGYAE